MQRRTQDERSAATRAALLRAGRRLFGTRGYDHVGTGELATGAGVSRGALYHQYADKAALFADVFEAVESDLADRLAATVLGASDEPAELLRRGVGAWLDACREPDVRQIVLLDGPRVLGWAEWRAIAQRHGQGLTEALLADAIERGVLADHPVGPMAQILVGALNEAALLLADSDHDDEVRSHVEAILDGMLAGLRVRPGQESAK